MNAGCNVFGSGNRANATIGRALRLVLLNVGGGWPGLLDKSTLGHPGKYTYCIAENEEARPFAPYHVEHGYRGGGLHRLRARRRATAQRHQPFRERRGRDTRQRVLRDEHDLQQQRRLGRALRGGPRARARRDHREIRLEAARHPPLPVGAFGQPLGRPLRQRALRQGLQPQPARRGTSASPTRARPIVPGPDHIHLFVAGGEAGRFSAFIPGWGHMSSPVLRGMDGAAAGGRAAVHRRHVRALASSFHKPGVTDEDRFRVYDPRGGVEAQPLAAAPRVKKLEGLRLGLLDNTKWNANKLLRGVRDRLAEKQRLRRGQLLPQGELLARRRAGADRAHRSRERRRRNRHRRLRLLHVVLYARLGDAGIRGAVPRP